MALLRHSDAGGVILGSLSRQLGAFAAGQPVVTRKATGPRELFLVEVDATLSLAPAEGQAEWMTLRQGRVLIEMTRP